MTEHKDMQDPKKYSDKDYEKFEYQLFAEDTPAEILKDIIMTLAHLPTKRAQALLDKFSKSDRADEVEWLEPAMDEGHAWYIWPQNDQEERDMMALKLYHKKNAYIIDLLGKCDSCEYRINQYQIELSALEVLQKDKLNKNEEEDVISRIMAIKELIGLKQGDLEKIENEIALEKKIIKKIKAGIKTERYKNLEPWDIDAFHFDGEE